MVDSQEMLVGQAESLQIPQEQFVAAAFEQISSATTREDGQRLLAGIEDTDELLEKLQLPDSTWDVKDPQSWGKAFITLTIGARMSEVSFDEQIVLSDALLELFPEAGVWNSINTVQIKDRVRIEEQLAFAISRHIWPKQMKQVHSYDDWEALMNSLVDSEHIIRLPYRIFSRDLKTNQSIFMQQIARECNIPFSELNQYDFYGKTFVPGRFIWLWEDTSDLVKDHERQHNDNDGACVGRLGTIFNEGLAQYRALVSSMPRLKISTHSRDLFSSARGKEVELITVLRQTNESLFGVMNDYFIENTVDGAIAQAQELIHLVGLDGYSFLYVQHADDPWTDRIPDSVKTLYSS